MADNRIITHKSVHELLGRISRSGVRVMAPSKRNNKLIFDEIKDPANMIEDYIQTDLSAKKAVFPKYEEILHYTFNDSDIVIDDEKNTAIPTVIYGTRPCDAKSFGVLDSVFLGDHEDIFYRNRREVLTIISVSCISADKNCFCTSLGGAPGDTTGSDILLTPIEGDRFLAEILTARGAEILQAYSDLFSEAESIDKSGYLADVKSQFDGNRMMDRVEASFNSELYINQSLRCLGCGACTYVCPTCTCFDIQDETEGNRGVRIRLWDSCGFSHFTLHTSWHNPRHDQSKRWRQRIMHKFYYQPDTLKLAGCVGCGRCSRACPADMNLIDHLKAIAEI